VAKTSTGKTGTKRRSKPPGGIYAVGRKRKLPRGCYFSEEAARRAVDYIECLRHTKGRWAGQLFKLLPWQKQIIRDVFGTLKANGKRLYNTVYIEIPKKNGKSELGAAIALYLLFGDGEPGPEVYSAAADKKQAGIVYNVAKQMFQWEPALQEDDEGHLRGKVIDSTKRIVNYELGGYYEVVSSEAYSKHGYNVHGYVFDELHAQPDRRLYDVLTEGSGDAREQPLFVLLTTAGTDRTSICWELHEKARKILCGLEHDPTFYAVIFGIGDDEDWEDEKVWKRCNPSLGHIIDIEKVRNHFREAKKNPAKENNFRQLRLNQWVKSAVKPIPLRHWDDCGGKVDLDKLVGRVCYAGLDLARTIALTSLALVFPEEQTVFNEETDDVLRSYDVLMRFWMPEETVWEHEKRGDVEITKWVKRGLVKVTPGATTDYRYIIQELNQLRKLYDIKELAYDRWGSVLLINDLQDEGFAVDEKKAGAGHPLIIPFGQGYKSMSPATTALINMVLEKEKRLRHGGNPVLRWNIDNLVVTTDPAGNVKPDKAKASQYIDGAVALIMALDRAIRHEGENFRSAYEEEGLTII